MLELGDLELLVGDQRLVVGGAGTCRSHFGLEREGPAGGIAPTGALGQQRGLERLDIVWQGLGDADHDRHGIIKAGP